MRIATMVMGLLLILGLPLNASAQTQKVEGPYVDQLSNYPSVNDEFLQEKLGEIEQQKEKNKELKFQDFKLEKEYNALQTGIETKEESIERLKSLNEKMQKAQKKMGEQYSELEVLFNKQKEENKVLKEELEEKKTAFFEKMRAFYQKEYDLLDDKIETLQSRREELGIKLEAMKEDPMNSSAMEEE